MLSSCLVHERKKSTVISADGLPSFSSEDRLQEALAGLLCRLPFVSDVRILQGRLERGKDIVFVYHGPFGERINCACIVKNTPISGKAGASGGARTILQQIQQALDTPYTNGDGTDIYIHRAYVVSPHGIGTDAMESIGGALQRTSGQIAFITGHQLFQLFKRYWPDFFRDECSVTDRYLSDFRRELVVNNPLSAVSTLYDLGGVNEREATIYVRPSFLRIIEGLQMRPDFDNFLPTDERLLEPMTGEMFDSYLRGLRELSKLLRFLAAWEFWPAPSAYNQRIQSTASLIDDLHRVLRSGWSRLPPQIDKRTKAETRKFVTTGGLAVFHPEPGKTIPLATAREMVVTMLELIRFRLQNLNEVLQRTDPFISALAVPGFVEALGIHDSLHHAPANLLDLKSRREIRLPKDLLSTHAGPLLIVGAPGSGKTSFCRWNALNDAEQYATASSSIIPIYVPLHRLSTGPLVSFERAFLSALGASALVHDDALQDWTGGTGRLRLYLDGLDEVVSERRRKELIDLLRDGLERFPRVQAVVTARDFAYGPYLQWLPRVTLSGLDGSEIRQLISDWLANDKNRTDRFMNQLSATPSLTPLMRVPFLATLVILVFRRTGQLPESIARLYSMFVDLLCGGWDLAKGVARPSRFGKDAKLLILTATAEWAHLDRRKEFSSSDLRVIAGRLLHSLTDESFEDLKVELTEDGLLGSSGGVYQFAHLSLQEFLTARSMVSDPSGKKARHGLRKVLERDDWWRQVLRFYIALVADPSALAMWLLAEFDRYANAEVDAIIGTLEETFPYFDFESIFGRKIIVASPS